MTQRRIWIVLAVVVFIVISIIMATVLRDVIRQAVVEPILKVYLQMQMAWRSLRSDVVWGFFILISILLAVLIFPTVQQQLERSFARTSDALRKRGHLRSPNYASRSQLSRVAFWNDEVQQMYDHRFLTRFTVIELKKLVLDHIAFKEKCETRHQAERWLLENPDRVPQAVLELFTGDIHKPTHLPGKQSGWLVRLLLSWGWITPDVSPVSIDRNLDAILAYLERKPEVNR